MPPVSAPRKNRKSTLLERRYAIALRKDMGLSYPEIERVTGFCRTSILIWCSPEYKKKHRESERRWRKDNPSKNRLSAMRGNAKKGGYGGPSFSAKDLDDYFETHDGCCDICRGGVKIKALHVEHCHETGALRGLTCAACNNVLGRLELVGADKFLDYLAKPPIAGGT